MVSYLAVQDVAMTDHTTSGVDARGVDTPRPALVEVSSPGSDIIQPELDLSRPGLKTYVWQICGGQILIEVSDSNQIKVNGEPLTLAAKRA